MAPDPPPHVRLRPATSGDADALLAWRNDPATRAASFDTRPVARDDHLAWVAGRLADPSVRLLIVEAGGRPVGQVRLDADASRGSAEVSIGLGERGRGRGLSVPALEAACAVAADELSVTRLVARIKPSNAASLRAFASAGFTETARDRDQVVMERPARRAP